MIAPAPKSYPLRGKGNALLTVSLFHEPWIGANSVADGLTPVFTLHTDRDGYINAHRTFVVLRDPTGVLWAEMYLEGVHHLNRLMKCEWFREAFDIWKGETEQLVQAEALQKVRDISQGGSPASFQAAKYLANEDWKRSGRGRGRPSKAELQGALKNEVDRRITEEDDLARIQGIENITGSIHGRD